MVYNGGTYSFWKGRIGGERLLTYLPRGWLEVQHSERSCYITKQKENLRIWISVSLRSKFRCITFIVDWSNSFGFYLVMVAVPMTALCTCLNLMCSAQLVQWTLVILQ